MNLCCSLFATYALAVSCALSVGLRAAGAITLGQVDDFQDGGIANWESIAATVTVTNVANAGPNGAGDNALDLQFGSRIIIPNTDPNRWTGNYTAAGVAMISMDVQHSNDFPLLLRLGVANGPIGFQGSGDTYVTADSVTIPNDGQWHHVSFGVLASDFVPSTNNTNPTPSAANALTSVTLLRILYPANPMDFIGAQIPAEMRLDNIRAEGASPNESADFDDDGDVDGADFLAWQRNLGTGTQHNQGDANFSGQVDADDLTIWKDQFSTSAPPVAAVPEPAAAVIFLLGGVLVRVGRRRAC